MDKEQSPGNNVQMENPKVSRVSFNKFYLVYLLASVAVILFNLKFLLFFFDKPEQWMYELLAVATFISLGVATLIHKRFSNLRFKVACHIAATYVLLFGFEIIRLALTSFSNPNATKWAVLGLFFVPFYVAPTVLILGYCLTKFFETWRLRQKPSAA